MIKVYAIPQGEETSEDFSVVLNDTLCAKLYKARVSAMPYNTTWPGRQRPVDQTELASFFSFEMDEAVNVHLKAGKDFNHVVIRPLSENISARTVGRDIYFTIQKTGQYTVELDGFSNALHIFANPVADFGIDTEDSNVIYFGPGIHKTGVIDVKSNQTVYIDAGAVVYGTVSGINVKNVSIVGYGIIDGSEEIRNGNTPLLPYDYDHDIPKTEEGIRSFLSDHHVLNGCIRFYNSQNITITGVVCRDAATFAVIPAFCDNVVIDNIKAIGMWRYNSDGIDIFNSSNCIIRNCFLRNFDDCVVLKGIKGWDTRNVENILVQNCVIWCDWGRALEIGAETCADEYRNIIFEDCDVIHGNDIMLDIQNGDRAHVHDVTFMNIRCEYNKHQLPTMYQHDMQQPYSFTEHNWQPLLIKMHSYCQLWSRDNKMGNIHNITCKDIYVLCEDGISMPKTVIEGPDEEHVTKNIVIDGLYFNGVKIDTITNANIDCNQYTSDITLK